jgi:hypothetical protein
MRCQNYVDKNKKWEIKLRFQGKTICLRVFATSMTSGFGAEKETHNYF